MSEAGIELPAQWLDAVAFGTRVLRSDESPWRVPAQMGPFLRELCGYLGLGPMQLDLAKALEIYADARDEPVEDRLDDPRFRAALEEALASTLATAGDHPVVLAVPGPGRLAAGGDPLAPANDDLMDDAAFALTDLLRAVFVPGLSALAVDEERADALSFLAPLRNLAGDYGVPLILRGPAELIGEGACQNADRLYTVGPVTSLSPGETATLRYAELPADTSPEDALAIAGALYR